MMWQQGVGEALDLELGLVILLNKLPDALWTFLIRRRAFPFQVCKQRHSAKIKSLQKMNSLTWARLNWEKEKREGGNPARTRTFRIPLICQRKLYV